MNVVITGANRGIGKELVTQFAQNHYNIWACARKQYDAYETEIEQIEEVEE